MSFSVPANASQNLLKRRVDSTVEEFSKHYKERHGPLAMPWFLENGVEYYAQVGATYIAFRIHRLRHCCYLHGLPGD